MGSTSQSVRKDIAEPRKIGSVYFVAGNLIFDGINGKIIAGVSSDIIINSSDKTITVGASGEIILDASNKLITVGTAQEISLDGSNKRFLVKDASAINRILFDGATGALKISDAGDDVLEAAVADLALYFNPTTGDLTIRGDPVNTSAEIFSHLAVEHWWDNSGSWVDEEGALFLVDGDNFSNQNVYFEAVLKSENGTHTTSARIYNITDGGVLADSTISTTSTTATRLRSSALTFPSGSKEYKIQFRYNPSGGAGNSGNIYAARLVHIQT